MQATAMKEPICWEYPGIIKDIIEGIGNPYHKALLATMYATAGRINEVVTLKWTDVYMQDGFLIFRLRTEKNKRKPYREIPVPLSWRKEKWLYDAIVQYVAPNGVLQNHRNGWLWPSPENPKKHITDRMVRYIVKKYFGPDVHPHLFRHTRLTHIAKYYRWDTVRFVQFAGWTDTAPAKVYLHLRWADYVEPIADTEKVRAVLAEVLREADGKSKEEIIEEVLRRLSKQ